MKKYRSEIWVTIPVAPNYEMDRHGRVRNKKTGRILKPYTPKKTNTVFSLCVDTVQKTFAANNLFWLTHGTIRGKSTIAVPIILTKGNEQYYFDTTREAARFIARRENYSPASARYYFRHRRREVYGWRINYQR